MEYASPSTVNQAGGLLADSEGSAHILAGGTDLVVQISAGLRKPDVVVDIKQIQELTSVQFDADGIRIGAAVSGAEINESPEITAKWLSSPLYSPIDFWFL